MFNFLLSEEWWMEALTAAIIAAGAAIIGSIITAVAMICASSKSTDDKLDKHEGKCEVRQKELSGEHAQLLFRQNSLSNEVTAIKGTVTYLKEGRIADEARRESMKGQMLDSQKALVVLEASLSQMADLNARLSEAKKEIAALQKENDDLRRENANLQEQVQSFDRSEEEIEI